MTCSVAEAKLTTGRRFSPLNGVIQNSEFRIMEKENGNYYNIMGHIEGLYWVL